MEGRTAEYDLGMVTGAMIEMLLDSTLIRCDGHPWEVFEQRSNMT